MSKHVDCKSMPIKATDFPIDIFHISNNIKRACCEVEVENEKRSLVALGDLNCAVVRTRELIVPGHV